MTAARTGHTVRRAYELAVGSGKFSRDSAQESLVARLDQLARELVADARGPKPGAFGWLLAKGRSKSAAVRGLYIHGAVGRGKTALMDMFFDNCAEPQKKRAHFHAFMQDVHERIHAQRQAFKRGDTREVDPVAPVARGFAREFRLLCFDEFHVLDIADAMILSRLFKVLFEEGVVLVATSNIVPDDLYFNGLNRELFLPFIQLLKHHVDVFNLDARTDYRRERLKSFALYRCPLGPAADAAMNEAWELVSAHQRVEAKTIIVRGHQFQIPQSCDAAARFSFDDLCARPLGAADYLALARRYATIFIDHVPHLDFSRRNEAKRFIILIDVLYDYGSRLFISADSTPDDIYQVKAGLKVGEFARTSSRLIEMTSDLYLKAWQQQQDKVTVTQVQRQESVTL